MYAVTMADDRVVSEIVTDFFLNSCFLRRRLNIDALTVMTFSSFFLDIGAASDNEVDVIPLSTGSIAEFYIDPMLSCVGDVDIMYHRSSELAIPQGHLPPSQLPAEFHGRVGVCEIIDSEFPGYVYLVVSYLLTEITDDGTYNAAHCQHFYTAHSTCDRENRQGPALVFKNSDLKQSVMSCLLFSRSLLSCDLVYCVRCLSWPSQAADWPIRHRNYGWPDSATVDRVVSNGCDIVGVAHRLCRQDEWMRKYQWRLSFSRAEITLLNSWMPVQQIVFHMLRFFVKTESLTDITDSTGSKILSNYNIKTLILWASEMKVRSWWIDELNVVGICVGLLHILADWLTVARCPHYFINNCNLFDSLDNSHLTHMMADKLLVTEAWLARWFVNNYIRKCGHYCHDRVSRLFDDINANVKLQNVVSVVVIWRLRTKLTDSWIHFSLAQRFFYTLECFLSPSIRTCLYLTTELSKNDNRVYVYFTAVTFLHVALKTNRSLLTDEMLDVLSTICLQSKNIRDVRRCLNARHSSVLSLSQAAKLMKVVANNSRSTVQLIEIELSKAYLYRALRCKDSGSNSIYCLANVYLAVLYYTTGQYQKAVDHCTVVTRSHDHSQCSSRVVQGELMPKIDDSVDGVLGLAVFFQYVRTAALNQQQQTQHVSVFSTELIAHYLHIRCQSVVKCRQFLQLTSADEVQRYEKCLSESSQMFITDVILFDSVRRTKYPGNGEKTTSSRQRTKPLTTGQLDTSELVELLQKSAVERLTTFRQLEAREFDSMYPVVTTDFEALYAYKRGDYQHCLQLSTQNVHTLTGDDRFLSRILVYSDFIQLMNDDLVCLTGLTLLVNPSCRENDYHVAVSQLNLSLYLMTQCQMKLHYPVTSLAQILNCIEVLRRESSPKYTLDQLLLKLTGHKILRYISLDGQY